MFVEYILFDSKGNKKFIIVSRLFRNMDIQPGYFKMLRVAPDEDNPLLWYVYLYCCCCWLSRFARASLRIFRGVFMRYLRQNSAK